MGDEADALMDMCGFWEDDEEDYRIRRVRRMDLRKMAIDNPLEEDIFRLTELVVDRLKPWGAYIYYHAATGSVYVKFPHWGLGSVRLADHKGIAKYAYRWNFVATKESEWKIITDRGIRRLFFGKNNFELFITTFESEAKSRGIKPGDEAEYPIKEKTSGRPERESGPARLTHARERRLLPGYGKPEKD